MNRSSIYKASCCLCHISDWFFPFWNIGFIFIMFLISSSSEKHQISMWLLSLVVNFLWIISVVKLLPWVFNWFKILIRREPRNFFEKFLQTKLAK